MKPILIFYILFALISLQAKQELATPALKQEAPAEVVRLAETLLKGVEDNDLTTYHSACDETLKLSTTAETLDELNMLLGEAMEMGYKKEYLGKLEKGETVMYLWRLNFDVKGIPDMLAEILVKEGKASGFSVR